MQHADEQSLVTVSLNNLCEHLLPRVFDIRKKLDEGEVLTPLELDFFSQMIQSINICQREAQDDHECQVIFSTVAHLLNGVMNQALDNERQQQAGLA